MSGRRTHDLRVPLTRLGPGEGRSRTAPGSEFYRENCRATVSARAPVLSHSECCQQNTPPEAGLRLH